MFAATVTDLYTYCSEEWEGVDVLTGTLKRQSHKICFC